jgi:3-oxoacyl-[acyl-carrier protein] reductase
MNNRIALVTGSSRGIGKAIALELARKDYDLIVHYRKSEDKASDVVEEIKKLGQEAYMFKADVSKDEEVKALFDQVTSQVGSLDLLVNNAGFDYAKLIEDYTLDEMRYVIDVVLFSKISATKYALPLLKESERPVIVNIASRMGADKTIATIGPYGPAEAGVIKWTQCCALEFADYGIRVNCVAPGLTRTDLTEDILSDDEFRAAGESNPRRRVGQPQDIANAVAFVASEKADYINAETINVNGGSNLG